MKLVLRRIFEQVARGQKRVLMVVFADGAEWRSGVGDPDVTIIFLTEAAERRTVLLGYVGFFESWFAGQITLEGRRPVGQLMRIAYTSGYRYRANPLLLAMRTWLEWRDRNRNSRQAQTNARRHYGLPHALFRRMLGEDCLYAEGYWANGITTLEEAQRNRCDYICRKLRLRPGDRLVEVGSGWGYQAIHAAERYGATVVNYGLVPEQNRVMQALLERRNLTERVRIVENDHMALVGEFEAYDRYLSVGVYEHAGPYDRAWIRSIAAALKPGGIGLISTTGYIARSPLKF